MAVSGSDHEIHGVKRIWENSDFPSDRSKPKYKRRKVSARRDFPKGLIQFAAASGDVAEPEELEAMGSPNSVVLYHVGKVGKESDYEQEELEAVGFDDHESPVTKDDVLSQPIYELPEILYARHDYPVVFDHVARKICARRDYPEAFYANSSHFVKVEREESESEPEEVEAKDSDDHESPVTKDDVLSQPICELPEILYARHDYPVVFYHVARKICARRDYPEAFYANSSHFVKVEREESESEPEELEAIDSDDDLTTPNPNHVAEVDKTQNNCELEEIDKSHNAKPMGIEPICSVEKMESEMPKGMEDKQSVNQIVGSTEPLESSRMRGAAGGKRGDYIQYLLDSLDHMAATLMQMKQQGAFKKRSAV